MKSPDDAVEGSGSGDHRRHRHHHHPASNTLQSGNPSVPAATQSEEARALLSKSEGDVDQAMDALEKRIREKSRAASQASDGPHVCHEPAGSFEALLERKRRAAAASSSTSAAAADVMTSTTISASAPRTSSSKQAAEVLDRRINAKLAANHSLLEPKDRVTPRDIEMLEQGIVRDGQDEKTNAEDELQATAKSDKDTDDCQRESEDMFREQGRSNVPERQDSEIYYPNVTADTRIMQEIAQEGIQVDESGAIQAYVADAVIDEADVVAVIKSDEEIEREERREYFTFFGKAVACIVFLIVIIGVPVTLKVTKVIPDRVVVITESPTESPSSMPSQSPSTMPSSIGFTEVVEKLLPISGETLMDVVSPQHKAARWIADEDPMQLDINDPGFEQRYAMAVFYYSLDGDNWNSKDGWLSGQSECDWEFVTGPGCVDGCINGKVCALKMDGWLGSQKGTLPEELGVLTEIVYFELQYRENDLTGSIPSSIGTSWTKLTAFLVAWNRLHGAFPFVNNPMLGTIFFNGNMIEDNIDKLTTLKSLSWLEAETNNFIGTLPEAFIELPYLWKVRLTNNSLTGAIPDTFTNASLLESFLVSGNRFTGGIPPSLATIPNLRKLELSRNLLTGSIPSSLYQMQNLQELHIDNNNLGGSLSQVEEPLYIGVREFAVNNNAFEGRFPVEQFEKTEILNILALQGNQLTGSITQSICQRLDESNPNARLKELSVDCNFIECTCCTCY